MEKCKQCDKDYGDHDASDPLLLLIQSITHVTTDGSSESVLYLVWKETMNEFQEIYICPRRLVTACLPGCDTSQDLRSEDRDQQI